MNEFENLQIDKIRKMIRDFNNDENAHRLENHYSTKSLPEIVRVSRKELVHSNFIAWILNPKESHSLQDFPLRKFLELILINAKENQINLNKELFDAIIISDFELENISISTEKAITQVGRIDIYIEFSIKYNNRTELVRIIVENKVTSTEQNDQTQRYFNYYEQIKKDNEVNLYVYLTAIPTLELMELEEPECNCKEYIQINYQYILDNILEPSLHRNTTERTKFIIKEYIQSLSQPTLDEEDEQYKQGLIMALGEEERNLLTKFWEKNQKLILATLYAISSDPEQDKDTRDSTSNAIANLSNSERDHSRYNILFNGNIEAEGVIKADIGLETIQILDEKELINEETFEFLKEDRSCSFNLLKSLDEITEGEKQYKRYRYNKTPELKYNNTGYYVARNWGVSNTDKFIKKMTEKFEQLEYVLA